MASSSLLLLVFVALSLSIQLVYTQKPNVIVSLDGKGDYLTVGEAVKTIPDNSDTLYSIYIKAGVYKESVDIGNEKRNVVIFGDGMDKTIITFDKSNSSGFRTSESATLNVNSDHFLARDIGIINSAGPKGEQAVALRFAGNYMACHRCSIKGYQDTLYVDQGNNQFFYGCDVYGTIDFIFGDAAVVLQNSIVHVGLPAQGQTNVITAQGRTSAQSDTAIVIHNCTIIPTPELNSSNVKTYLGRPWKEFSRTIIMESYLDRFIDPEGWMKFNETSNLATLYYAEYNNRGLGASTNGRVNWPGYHILKNPNEVQHFTVDQFIKGSEWLSKLDVPFIGGLIG